MTLPRPRRLLILLLLCLLAGGAVWWFWQRGQTPAQPAVLTAAVTRGDIEQTVLASGTLRPARLVAVGSQVSGRITSVDVTLGQTVKAGDLIAQIDSRTQENALKTAEAALAASRAQRVEKEASLRLAEITLTRQAGLYERRAVSQADVDTARANVDTANAQIAALDAQIEQGKVAVSNAQTNLGYTRITAPIEGTVLAVTSQQGQTLNANQSTPTIVVLGQLDRMTVEAEISEADILKVSPGQDVYFSVLGDSGRRYEGKLETIDPAPESITSDRAISTSASASSSTSSTSAIYYFGNFDIDNADGRLRTYMTAEVHIVLGRATGVLTIPSAAVSLPRADGSRSVQVQAADGSVSRRAVEIGLDDKVTAEVLSGLQEGDRVVTGTAAGVAGDGSQRRPRGPMGF
ncbi:efflux RND transporter periplasmic adaptor subunit [Haematobacter massiliensis]|uniref:Hemolysin secretion protein D n=1 Tax=Haematobacter massiliensis TaxID=195105 RepID=A0A086Y397_9RHOB|nr:efflux RND transporter periplasmic adaptor subunit [Haematobacter massiliensis]KFI28747.1 hemolysin secretion protein D [Haematobacter massiliensis]OWJ73995.1 efflux RND transporter periplasmic adaptor subunit [Haematobacter massiliensis]OWJ85247.1 efflux RND transporter periplasmic adaptor subunit [Haematobacter massiliensis]QBJ26066.1 efflux RND transporter periplasmic adaptor subunit [Haematobacter massiliensis]